METGSIIKQYKIISPIGKGGMGEVFLAQDTKLDRKVAIKFLSADFAADEDRVRRFELEAKATSALNHPNILTVHDIGKHHDSPFIVMELLEGRELRESLDGGAISPRKTVEYAGQIVAGLSAAHEKGIVHRDLKPENIFITEDDRVKILDFGLAKLKPTSLANETDSEASTRKPLTNPGAVMGTVGYMSPEQVRGAVVDYRSDIFSFGVILYEMLTGNKPFAGDSVIETLNAILKEDVPEFDGSTKISPALEKVMRRCLEKKPEHRFHSAHDLGFALEALSVSTSSTENGAPMGAMSATTAPARRFGFSWIAAGVMTLAAVALSIVLWGEFRTANIPPQFQKLTFGVQFITNARLTSDGRTTVFSAARDRMKSEMFVLRPEDQQPRKLGGDNMQLLAVSKTGELAVLTDTEYISHRTYVGTLSRMPLADAPPRQVVDRVTAADWSPDGNNLAVVRQIDNKSRLEYPVGTVLAESSGYLSDVRISPSGDLVAFMEHDLVNDNRGPVVIVDRGGVEKARSPIYRGEEGLAWAPDGKGVFFSAQSEHTDYMIWELTVGGSVRMVLTGAANLILHDMHSSGKFLLSTETNMSYLVSHLAGETAETDVLSLEFSYPAAISADGRSLLFTDESLVNGDNYGVSFQSAPNVPAVRLGEGSAQDISPDGKYVVAVVPTTPPRIVIYPIGAGTERDVSPAGFVSIQRVFFFPDGKRLLFNGSETGKGARCYTLELSGGVPRAVTPEGVDWCRLSADGLSVVARRLGAGWFRFSIGGDEVGTFSGLTPGDEVIRWSRDGRSLFVLANRNVSPRIERYEIATGKRTLVQALTEGRTSVTSVWNAVLSADEVSYAYYFDRTLSILYAVEGVR